MTHLYNKLTSISTRKRSLSSIYLRNICSRVNWKIAIQWIIHQRISCRNIPVSEACLLLKGFSFPKNPAVTNEECNDCSSDSTDCSSDSTDCSDMLSDSSDSTDCSDMSYSSDSTDCSDMSGSSDSTDWSDMSDSSDSTDCSDMSKSSENKNQNHVSQQYTWAELVRSRPRALMRWLLNRVHAHGQWLYATWTIPVNAAVNW